ncbi:MAG: MFS transporter [Acidobacteria bacterium]|nr:MFS transporter [Acidobacteriaceae bacterium]MBV9608936.1 MFS transporter [Acidobacteriota bacterium]
MAVAAPGWLAQTTKDQRRTLVAASLGWMLDAFDVMLYALVLAYIMRDLGMSKPTAGLLNTFTLLASGLGGLFFGFLADRIGRTRALMLSILTYSIFSFASGLATSVKMLAACRFVLGLGMGGEWNTGATLVAETWPTNLRARAMAMVQSSWAIGYALAALVAGTLLHYANWRVVFFVGVLPALVTLWIRKDVPESDLWRQHRASGERAGNDLGIAELFSRPYVWPTFSLLLLNVFGLFAWWGLFTWVPAYLSLPVEKGGRGFNASLMTTMLVILNLTGMFPGYISFGFVADRLGRRRAFALYLAMAALLVPLYGVASSPWKLVLLGTPVAFFGTGFFSGSGLAGSEIFPTRVRARALGFTYNGARMVSSLAPFVIGYVGQRRGLGPAFFLCSVAFLLAAVMALQLPETKGKQLE